MNKILWSKKSDEWSTPQTLFDSLNEEFHFTIDVAANETNHKCDEWLGPDSPLGSDFYDAIKVWVHHETIWLNPPYSRIGDFMERADYWMKNHCTVVALLPARTDTKWWHAAIWDRSSHQPRKGVQVRFIRGRLKFGDSKNSAPFPSVIVVFKGV